MQLVQQALADAGVQAQDISCIAYTKVDSCCFNLQTATMHLHLS